MNNEKTMGPVNNEKSQSKETTLNGGCMSERRRQTRSEAKKNNYNVVNSLLPYNEVIYNVNFGIIVPYNIEIFIEKWMFLVI